MSVTATAKRVVDDALKENLYTIQAVTLSGTYATGGFSYDSLFEGIDTPLEIAFVGDGGGYVLEPDYVNKKIKIYYGDNNNASDGPLIELPDTTALPAALTSTSAPPRFRVVGK